MTDRRPIRIERRFANPIERVWRAVSEPDELARWFVATVPWKPELGETFEAYGQRGEITACDPPRVLAWTYGVERYRFELEPDGDGCRLVFTHAFNPDLGPAEQHERGWRAYFARLDAHLAGGYLSEEEAHAAL
jgi:uncharacterized protein YndB with AHSA1/START domain